MEWAGRPRAVVVDAGLGKAGLEVRRTDGSGRRAMIPVRVELDSVGAGLDPGSPTLDLATEGMDPASAVQKTGSGVIMEAT